MQLILSNVQSFIKIISDRVEDKIRIIIVIAQRMAKRDDIPVACVPFKYVNGTVQM